jgi:hypothetical protein
MRGRFFLDGRRFGIRHGGTGMGAGLLAAALLAQAPSGNSLLTAVQHLGLKLEPRKLPLDTVVVDHVEKTPFWAAYWQVFRWLRLCVLGVFARVIPGVGLRCG